MKYLGEETTREVIKTTVRKVEYIRCDRCEKKIMPSNYRGEKNNYIHVHTWHNDWGNDSVDSHQQNDYCIDCAKQVVSEYITTSSGTEELELQNEYLLEGETYKGFDECEFDACLVDDDDHQTEKGGEENTDNGFVKTATDRDKIVKILKDTETWNDPCEYCQKSSDYCNICEYEDYADRLLRSGAVAVIVRCKDCIHRDKAGLCQAEGQKLTIVKDNHFCGKGERKDGEQNGL